MFDWLEDHGTLFWLTGASIAMFAGTFIALPVVLVRLPADYFQKSTVPLGSRSTGWVIARNILGWICIVVGLAMLLLPGPGILMILIGVVLVDFPGKHRVQRWIISRKKVLATANWLRKKFGKPQLKVAAAAPN
jgi:hypothetical protein